MNILAFHSDKYPNPHRTTVDSVRVGSDRPLRIEPYALSPPGWWCCIDTATGRSFGGRYTPRECAFIVSRFRDWRGPITPRDFGAVAEDAIRLTRMMEVAA